jgi:hypothetical protein
MNENGYICFIIIIYYLHTYKFFVVIFIYTFGYFHSKQLSQKRRMAEW